MEKKQKSFYYLYSVSRLSEQIEKIRAQSPAFKQRFVFVAAVILTVVLVGGFYGIQAVARSVATKNTILAQQGIQQSSPFSILSDTWRDMIRYVEEVSEDIVPDRNIFQKKEENPESVVPINYPGTQPQTDAEQ